MGFNKKFFTTGGIVASSPSAAPFDPLQNFETVTYTGNGSTQKITGYIRKGAAFNGSSSKIVVSDSSTIFDAAGGFSASVWVNRNTTANQTILNKEGGVSGSYGWSLRFTSGAGYSYDLYDTSNNQVTVSTGANSTTGNWEHIIISFNNSDNKIRIYYNGGTAVVSSALPSAASSNTENFFIGARTTSAIVTDGKIDQVRIFNKAVSASEVTTLYGETYASATKSTTDIFGDGSGVALYELDENANDTSGNYNGTATAINFLGMAFQPDFVWIKSRSNGRNHRLLDSIRGATKVLSSDSTSNEYNEDSLTSFDSNGFTLGTGGNQNRLNETYVAWCWKAGGSAVSNTDGSITSQVSANTAAGFSIVKWNTGTGTNSTVGHGLSSVELVLYKSLSTRAWIVYSSPTGVNKYLRLNESYQAQSQSNIFATPTTTTFTSKAGINVGASEDYIAYCFHSVTGYQKVGSYTGTGVANTAIGDTGFLPRWVMIKRTDAGSSNWFILDSIRDTTSPYGAYLLPNASNAENNLDAYSLKFESTRFTVNSTDPQLNALNGTYIYLAIA